MSFKKYLEWLEFHRSALAFNSKSDESVPHPGGILNDDFLKKNKITQTELSKMIGCTHAKVNEVINGKRGITPEFALDLEGVTEIKAETWMRMQVYFDLNQLRLKQ